MYDLKDHLPYRRRRRPPTKVTPYLIEAVRQMSRRKLQTEIAKQLGIATTTVSRIQKRYGFVHFTRHGYLTDAQPKGEKNEQV